MERTLPKTKILSNSLKRWQYTYSGWLRLIKCKDMTKEEESAFHQRLWDDKEFGDKTYKEYNDWLAEGEAQGL